ncbi:MAG: shikimate kinase [Clostridia bacterium]|nr:shikimate kinase [Clostridia bacterium]
MDIGLIGRKLGHSLSPEIHKYLGSYEYTLRPMEPEELDRFFAERDFRGVNVTIPYKKDAAERCDELSETARRIGCVNTVIKRPDGSLWGDNTDYFGFSYMADLAGIDFKNQKTLILGSGGASLTARLVAADKGASEVIVISRTGENNYGNLDRHSDAGIIVNCTPVGMYPENGKRIVDLSAFPRLRGVLDMIYNPFRTPLILDAQAGNIRCSDGLPMLVAQGAKSAEYFRVNENLKPDIPAICRAVRAEKLNIVLVGMPGCGKSTVASVLAKDLGREKLDTDDMVRARAGKPIPAIFAEEGEAAFRDLEAACVYEAARGSGRVIATGGGAVLRRENREALRGNSAVVFLERPVNELSTGGRPLSKDAETLERMYAERLPLYRETADITVRVGATPYITAAEIKERLKRYNEAAYNQRT